MSKRRVLASCFCVAVGLACAAAPGASDRDERGSATGTASGFPPEKELDALLEQPLPADTALTTRYRDVDVWELEGPFPDVVGSALRSADSPLDALVDEFVAQRAGLVVASESLDCFAREIGRFQLAQHGLPGAALQSFAAGRCGVATAAPRFASAWWTGQPVNDEAEAVAALRAKIEARLRENVVGGPLEVGVWLHVGDGRVDLLVAMGERHIRIDPVPAQPGPDGRIELVGELLHPAAAIAAAATRGQFEWSDCEAEKGVALPRFHLTCHVAPDDETAWVDLQYHPPERLLGTIALSLLARPDGGEHREFRRGSYAPARPVSDSAALPAAFTELLNGVRAEAGLRPLVLDADQSESAALVAPYYFSALLGQLPGSIAELVALGMLAGWDVDGIVQEGAFTWAWLVESLDVNRLLSDALQHPGARMTLLARDAERLALGPVMEPSAGEDAAYLALIASTYTLFSEATHRRDVEHVQALLAKARAEQGRSAPGELDAVRPLTVNAAARIQAGEDPSDVLQDMIESGAELLRGRRVVGWMAETQDLDSLVFPEDFVSMRRLDLAVAVPVYRPEGQAWGHYVVLLLAAEPAARSL